MIGGPFFWPYRGTMTKVFVVLLALVASAALGTKSSIRAAVVALCLAGLLILWRKPIWGIILLLIASLNIPLQVSTGTQTPLHLAIFLIPALLGIWMMAMINNKSIALVPTPVNLPAIAFMFSASLSWLAGNIPWNYFADRASLRSQAGGWFVFVFSVGTLLLVGNLVKDVRWLKTLTWLFLALGTIHVLGRVLPLVGWLGSRLFAPGATGSLLWVWLVALAGGQLCFNRSLSKPSRLLLLGSVASTIGVGCFLMRDWVSGWLPALAALVTLVWLRSWRIGLPLTVILIVGLLYLTPGVPETVISENHFSIDTRQIAWQILINQVLPANPILGLGPANYYHYTPLYPIMGYYVQFNSHNQYVDLVAQLGILGLAIFFWLMAAIARLGWSLRERVGNGFARGYVYSCLAGLVGTLVAGMLGDWFLPFIYNIGLVGFRTSILGWLFLGGLIALEASARSTRGEN